MGNRHEEIHDDACGTGEKNNTRGFAIRVTSHTRHYSPACVFFFPPSSRWAPKRPLALNSVVFPNIFWKRVPTAEAHRGLPVKKGKENFDEADQAVIAARISPLASGTSICKPRGLAMITLDEVCREVTLPPHTHSHAVRSCEQNGSGMIIQVLTWIELLPQYDVGIVNMASVVAANWFHRLGLLSSDFVQKSLDWGPIEARVLLWPVLQVIRSDSSPLNA
ncbi:hypothetical protein N7539_003492 [Penicillium diatomitis]|uniref:Uncharacterized protein n=1 Tax=Penicillium diatomitis TaxID=2819901 RepID=A0A9W9XD86_9EURO|nr:uncharacterized protein N7539_003492 [Penicillium diatomitis]KAJ5488602.1 hypothetical protein N7539_003492 [Penicillium diatomitis]